MASYEQQMSTSALIDDKWSGLSQTTKDAISALLGAETTDVTVSGYDGTGPVVEGTQAVSASADVTSDLGAQVVVMEGNTSANVNFAADSAISAMVLGSGNNNVTFAADKNISVETTGGESTIATAGGNDQIVLKAGNATVNTGEGNDTVLLQGDGQSHITGGSGNMTVKLDTNVGVATIDAGDGFDQLTLQDSRAAHSFTIENGNVVMHSDNAITMKGVQVVTFDTNKDGVITADDSITVIAENAHDSLVATLYKVALGREAIDGADGWDNSTLGGLNWWMNEFEKGATDGSTEHLVRSFLNCDEFHQKYDGMGNADYVNTLISNAGISVDGAAWIAALESGELDREQVAYEVATNEQTVQLLGSNGENYIIEAFTE
ncbi:hypothetical protein [uncultured Desulfovibrio sp.]|uniref:hypothetical protein n=1 Tax=uncultured Desulfovibrio sp. TaxID=167968 RepID=UPI002636BEC5|nr:hypothetical protein [uncultured Desulfovibrio sp.]